MGLFITSAEVDEIRRVVRTASRGEPAFTPIQLVAGREAAERHLSPREHHIVGLLAAGQSNKELAARVGLSRRTSETYLTRLYRRVEASSRLELVNRLRADGLVDDAERPRRPGVSRLP